MAGAATPPLTTRRPANHLAMTGTDPGATVTTPGQSAYLKPGDQAGAFVACLPSPFQ
jgi:hypothetical protein